jgi:hypothetical protein
MLVVRLELHGHSGAEQLGKMQVINDGTGGRDVGHYDVLMFSEAGTIIRQARVEGHVRAEGGWSLTLKALEALKEGTDAMRRQGA